MRKIKMMRIVVVLKETHGANSCKSMVSSLSSLETPKLLLLLNRILKIMSKILIPPLMRTRKKNLAFIEMKMNLRMKETRPIKYAHKAGLVEDSNALLHHAVPPGDSYKA